jgi:hypothetical protein
MQLPPSHTTAPGRTVQTVPDHGPLHASHAAPALSHTVYLMVYDPATGLSHSQYHFSDAYQTWCASGSDSATDNTSAGVTSHHAWSSPPLGPDLCYADHTATQHLSPTTSPGIPLVALQPPC